MKRRNKNGRKLHKKLPDLLILGPIVVKQSDDLRRFLLIERAYQEGAMSLRKAHILCLENAKRWRAEECLVESWESFRSAAVEAESLFSKFFGTRVQLFVKPGEGMPFVAITDLAATEAVRLAKEFIAWCDHPDEFGVA